MKDPLVVILGPTASGKTKLAVALADWYGGEVISADSRQVFKRMDIGTGKDLKEYQIGAQQIPYHLIDLLEPGERYNVSAFLNDCYHALEHVRSARRLPILCGGTGMYIHALLQNHNLTSIPVDHDLRQRYANLSKEELNDKLQYYPVAVRAHADSSTHKRLLRAIEIAEFLMHADKPDLQQPKIDPLVIGLNPTVENRRQRILERLDYRLAHGLIEEVQQLLASGVSKEMLVFYGLEYKLTVSYLSGELTFSVYRERLAIAICQYAKRQMTFFRKMEKDGIAINWINPDQEFSDILTESKSIIDRNLSA